MNKEKTSTLSKKCAKNMKKAFTNGNTSDQ